MPTIADERGVSMTVPANAASRLHEGFDFLVRQIFTSADILVPWFLRHLSRKRWLVYENDLG